MADQNEPKKARLDRPYAGRRSMQETTNSDSGRDIPVLCRQIRYFRERKGIEQKELAAKVGIKSNAVSNWENGRTRPDIALLPLICQVLEVRMEELFNMPLSKTETVQDKAAERERHTQITVQGKTDNDSFVLEMYHRLNRCHRSFVESMLERLIDAEEEELYDRITETVAYSDGLCAGFSSGLELEGSGEPLLVFRDKVHPKMDCVFPVSGDSMEPEFHDGDLVMIERLDDTVKLSYGEIGAFSSGNNAYIKVYSKVGLRSLNKRYKVLRFTDTDSVMLIGRVLGVLDPEAIVSDEDIERYERVKQRMGE